MTRYLIKVTYTEGEHRGTSYLLRKGGYVTDNDRIQWEDTTYKSEGIARRVCQNLCDANELARRCERIDEEIRIKRGGKPKKWHIYDSATYEPYPVEVIPD